MVDSVGIGSIVRSVDNRTLISMEDTVGVGVNANVVLKPGDRLAVVRPAQRLIHPRTGLPISRVLYILGLVEIKEVKDRVVMGRVSYSCGAMSIGDLVMPYTPAQFPEGKIAQPTQRSVEGVVLDSMRGEQLIGMLQVVFLDVGAVQGVGPGDVFGIYRPESTGRRCGGRGPRRTARASWGSRRHPRHRPDGHGSRDDQRARGPDR